MSKGLEVLQRTKERDGLPLGCSFAPVCEDEIAIIENELKENEEQITAQQNLIDFMEKEIDKYEEFIRIIKEKEIDIKHIKDCKTIYEYSIYYKVGEMPTQEEFDLLKEVLK